MNYFTLLVIVPAVAMLSGVVPRLAELEPNLRGGLLVLVALASVAVCSLVLGGIFSAVAGTRVISRVVVGGVWGLAGLGLAAHLAAHPWVGFGVACLAAQVVVSLRPHDSAA